MAAILKLELIGEKHNFSDPLNTRIVLGENCGLGKDGKQSLTTSCASIIELESQVKSLKSQLDEIVKAAKTKFA